jgi:hypothetical protein
MAFTQQTFMGASIRSFNGTVGWGSSPSVLSVNLVEDDKNNDLFTPVNMGAPVWFDYSGWTFGGILKNWEQTFGTGGNPTYTAKVEDPRAILDGVQLILGNYSGSTFAVPNLLNVFGYLENVNGFGGADSTGAGIPWKSVRDGIVALTGGANNNFGNNILLGNSSYEIDLSQLPNLPNFYRIPALDMSLMAFITTVCEDANHDFHFTHISIGGVNFIRLHTINRNVQPQFGAITNFVNSTPGAVQKNAGFEFRNETTSKFVVGGNVVEMFTQGLSGGDDNDLETGSDNTIWPYWGQYTNGNVVIGEGINSAHTMNLDATWIEVWPYSNYPTDVAEMRAALGGEDSWQTFLWLTNYNKYRESPTGTKTATYVDPLAPLSGGGHQPKSIDIKGTAVTPTYKHDEILNPHFGKGSIINLGGSTLQDIAVFLAYQPLAKLSKIDVNSLSPLDAAKDANRQAQIAINKTGTLFQYIKTFASEHYGRKFMVRVPFVSSNIDSETGTLETSREVVDGAYLEESLVNNAVSVNLIAPDTVKFSLEDGRLVAFVKYTNANNKDFRDISTDDISINLNTNTAFIKCEVEPELVFFDRSLTFSPRAVIVTPGIVKSLVSGTSNNLGVVADFLDLKSAQLGGGTSAGTSFFESAGSDAYRYPSEGLAILPDNANIPLKSNITTYGPWYAAGANGKLDFEQDESLVPWNYGGFDAMNNSANAKISSAISNQLISEAGSIEFPDVPSISLGAQLALAGPYVTDVNVQIDFSRGATTTYSMRTWTPQPYKLRKEQADVNAKASVQAHKIRRETNSLAIRSGKANSGKAAIRAAINSTLKPPKPQGNTATATMIIGEQKDEYDENGAALDTKSTLVGIQPTYNTSNQSSSNSKGGITLDGIFQPFSAAAGGDLPSMEDPDAGATTPTVTDLNPYTKAANFGAVISDNKNLLNHGDVGQVFDDARSMALRGPVIIAGWGYDTNDKPVPADPMDEDAYLEDVNKRPDEWKVGPLDTRWDDTRKLWVAGGSGGTVRKARALEFIEAGATGVSIEILEDDGVTVDTTVTNALGDNFLGPAICDGSNLLVSLQDGKIYNILISQFNSVNVVTDMTCDDNILSKCERTVYIPAAFSVESCDVVTNE